MDRKKSKTGSGISDFLSRGFSRKSKSSTLESSTAISESSYDDDKHQTDSLSFLKLFPEVPSTSPILGEFKASLNTVKDGTISGRLYITATHICFASKNHARKLVIKVETVTLVNKKNSGLVSQDIIVNLGKEEHIFSGVRSRDTAYDLLLQTCDQKKTIKTKKGSSDNSTANDSIVDPDLGTIDSDDFPATNLVSKDTHVTASRSPPTISESLDEATPGNSSIDGAPTDQSIIIDTPLSHSYVMVESSENEGQYRVAEAAERISLSQLVPVDSTSIAEADGAIYTSELKNNKQIPADPKPYGKRVRAPTTDKSAVGSGDHGLDFVTVGVVIAVVFVAVIYMRPFF